MNQKRFCSAATLPTPTFSLGRLPGSDFDDFPAFGYKELNNEEFLFSISAVLSFTLSSVTWYQSKENRSSIFSTSMAAWPPINARSTPIVNTAGIPAMNTNTKNTPASSPSAPAIGSSNDGSNYHPWARAMTMALSCKNKLAFVNGAITKPSEDDLERFLAWERCNNMVMSWIVRALPRQLAGVCCGSTRPMGSGII
nr:uncharacterized protein LOC109181269 [Ipomoea batatas]